MTSELHPHLADEARLHLDERYTTHRAPGSRRRRRRFTADRRAARRPEL
jgi:hypothetical protein